MKYKMMVADPPYGFSDKLTHSDVARGAEANYPVLSNKDIMDLPIPDVMDASGSIIALWVPSSLMNLGVELMGKWGFDIKQNWIWCKTVKDPFAKIKRQIKKNEAVDWDKINFDNFMAFGMGRIARGSHEIALIGTKGKIYGDLKNNSQRTVFHHPNTKHSKKPEILQDRLELMFPSFIEEGKAIEIFARRERKGWLCLGNEVGNKKDIRENLKELING